MVLTDRMRKYYFLNVNSMANCIKHEIDIELHLIFIHWLKWFSFKSKLSIIIRFETSLTLTLSLFGLIIFNEGNTDERSLN